MSKIDLDKFICFLINDSKQNAGYISVKSIERALDEQGLKCYDGKIYDDNIKNQFSIGDIVVNKKNPDAKFEVIDIGDDYFMIDTGCKITGSEMNNFIRKN